MAYPCCRAARVQATEMRGVEMTGRIVLGNGRGGGVVSKIRN